MIYLDNGATSLHKPEAVKRAVLRAMVRCGNPGRSGHRAAMEAAETVYHTREAAGKLFSCRPEQVVFTTNCTHGLNMAIRTLVKPGARVVISGFEHNAVTRPLHALGAEIQVAGRHLFDWADTLEDFEGKLKKGVDAAVFTHVSNVFGYILPVEELASLCRRYGVPFVVDAAQSAGMLPVNLEKWGADFIAMPGHKGLLGPQGTGLLLCGRMPEALLQGGTGSLSLQKEMPDFLPDRAEAGTLNDLVSHEQNGAIIQELFTRDGVGTQIVRQSAEQVSQATINDIPSLMELIRPLEIEGILIHRPREQLEMEIDHYVVIKRDGMVIASAALYPYEEEGLAELACVAIHPNYRGNNRGDILINKIEELARQRNIKKLFVLTTKSAHFFLEKGFVQGTIEELPKKKREHYNYQRMSKILFRTINYDKHEA